MATISFFLPKKEETGLDELVQNQGTIAGHQDFWVYHLLWGCRGAIILQHSRWRWWVSNAICQIQDISGVVFFCGAETQTLRTQPSSNRNFRMQKIYRENSKFTRQQRQTWFHGTTRVVYVYNSFSKCLFCGLLWKGTTGIGSLLLDFFRVGDLLWDDTSMVEGRSRYFLKCRFRY